MKESSLKIRSVDYKPIFSFRIFTKRLILLSAFFFLMCSILPKPKLQNRTMYVAPPMQIKNLSAGLSIQLSDAFWLRAFQDFSYCDSPIRINECAGKSWLFQILNLVVELDKNFFEAYYYG